MDASASPDEPPLAALSGSRCRQAGKPAVRHTNRHAPGRRDADDSGKIVAPCKMLFPHIGSRVEKRHCLPGHTIERIGMGVFMGIAGRARAGKVVTRIGAALRKRDDVLDGKQSGGKVFLIAAVLAAAVGLGCHLPVKACANHLLW
jgi:hypothetical protein